MRRVYAREQNYNKGRTTYTFQETFKKPFPLDWGSVIKNVKKDEKFLRILKSLNFEVHLKVSENIFRISGGFTKKILQMAKGFWISLIILKQTLVANGHTDFWRAELSPRISAALDWMWKGSKIPKFLERLFWMIPWTRRNPQTFRWNLKQQFNL